MHDETAVSPLLLYKMGERQEALGEAIQRLHQKYDAAEPHIKVHLKTQLDYLELQFQSAAKLLDDPWDCEWLKRPMARYTTKIKDGLDPSAW